MEKAAGLMVKLCDGERHVNERGRRAALARSRWDSAPMQRHIRFGP